MERRAGREPQSDEDLMMAYAGGKTQAFNQLLDRHGRKIYNLFLRSLGNAEEARDLLQETFLRLVEARGRYRPRQKFSSWLYTIAMNLLRDQYRKNQRWAKLVETRDFMSQPPASGDAMRRPGTAGDPKRDAVVEAVRDLPDEQRDVILLAKYQGLSYAEIGRILGISPAAAKQRGYRALRSLREALNFLAGERP